MSENSTTLNHWKFEFKAAFKVFSFNVPREKIDQQHGKAAKQSVSWISEYSRKEKVFALTRKSPKSVASIKSQILQLLGFLRFLLSTFATVGT